MSSGGRRTRFTLVTTAHVCNNPRLVKAADALFAAGHDVRVVALRHRSYLAERDRALMASRRWRLDVVDVDPGTRRGRVRWAAAALRERLCRVLFWRGVRAEGITDRAVSRNLDGLLAAASAEPADVVIGHNLQALPVASRAARRLGARLGFDVEDLHTGELPDEPAFALQRALVADVERRHLPRCHYLTASSDGIADEIVRLYGVRRPVVVLNVFPASEREHPAVLDGERPSGARVSLYWYSQVIGAGRGLEEAVAALARLPEDVHLSLRGEPDPGFTAELGQLLRRHGVTERVHLLTPALPTELVARAARHDVGLALEQPATRNRQLCVTNKIFTYLLAGLGVAATDTPGQRAVMEQAADAGFTYPAGDVDALASGLRALAASPERLRAARESARRAAERRFNWEHESERLVAYLTEDRAVAVFGDSEACATS